METRHLSLVSDDNDAAFLASVSYAWALFDRSYPNAESRRTMMGSLQRLVAAFSGESLPVRSFPWHWLVSEDLAESVWLPVRDSFSARTAKKDAAALKSILRCYFRAGLLTAEQYRSAVSFDTRIRRASRERVGRSLTPQELEHLANAITKGSKAVKVARDLALLLILASTGARRNEIANLELDDVDLLKRRVTLKVTKNGAERHAWLHPNAVVALKDWIGFRGSHSGPLFHPLTRSCEPLTDRRLSPHQMWKILRAYADLAGIGALTPHDLRRFAVSTLLDLGYDLALVSRIVGHKQMTTTIGYDLRPEARCREAVSKLPVPAFQRVTA